MSWFTALRQMKLESNLTTREIAQQSGVPEPTLEKLFSGQTKDPKLNTMMQLVHFFGHTLDDLVPEQAPYGPPAPNPVPMQDDNMKALLENYIFLSDIRKHELLEYSHYLYAREWTERNVQQTGYAVAFDGESTQTSPSVEDMKFVQRALEQRRKMR